MAAATKSHAEVKLSIRPTTEDQKILNALRRKLGIGDSQLFRLAIRLLAAKEGVIA
jgi:hypothetical protein